MAGGLATLNHDLVGVFYDDGLYAGLAWATAHGHGYVYPNLPGTPAAIHYPPLYPWVLAPLFGLLSVPAAALLGKLLNVVCFAAAAGLIAHHAARSNLVGESAPPGLAPAVVALTALAIPCLTFLTVLLSEPLFTLLFVIAVLLADRPPRSLTPDVATLLAGGAAALALLVRSIGIAIGCAVMVRAYLDARPLGRAAIARRVSLAAAPLVVAALGWGAWVVVHQGRLDPLLAPDYGSYVEALRGTGRTLIGTSLSDLARPLGVLTLGWAPSRAAYLACGIPALGVGLYGLALCARRSAVGIALVTYLAILACWPFQPDRFLWAVLAWLALAWAAGAVDLWERARARRWLRIPLGMLAATLACGYVQYEWRGIEGRWWALAGHRTSETLRAVLPALDSLAPTAVIATDHDPLVWLYTRRATVPFSLFAFQGHTVLEPPPTVHHAYLERYGVTHILVTRQDGEGAAELERLRRAYPGWLRVVREWPNDIAMLLAVRER